MAETARVTSPANSSSVTTTRLRTLERRASVPSSFMRSWASSCSICSTLIDPPPGARRDSPITGSSSWPPPLAPIVLEQVVRVLRPPLPCRIHRDLLLLRPRLHHRCEDVPGPLGLVRPD